MQHNLTGAWWCFRFTLFLISCYISSACHVVGLCMRGHLVAAHIGWR